MIKCLAALVLNRGDLLLRMVDSIDVPIDKLCLLQNGNDDSVELAIQQLSSKSNPLIRSIYIQKPFRNMGVAASWNSIIKSFPECPYWIIANNDTVFLPGDLEKYHELYCHHENAVIVAPNGAFSCFLITPYIISKVGLFDENIWPIYNEDIDYFARMQLAGIDRLPINSEIGHSNNGSWTIRSNQEYAASNAITQQANSNYINEKWGSTLRHQYPWNHPSRDVKDWWYNPYFRLQQSEVWNHFEQTSNRIK